MPFNKALVNAVLEISETANRFQSNVVIITDTTNIDAKSILGLTYTVLSSQTFKLEVHGPDEKEAKTAMAHIFWKNKLPVEVI